MREHDLKHTDIAEIVAGWQKVEPFLAKQKVSTVVAAQASLPFALAVAAVRGQVTVDEFTEETVNDPVVRRCPDLTRARALLDYEPVVGLDEGLARTIAWYGAVQRPILHAESPA